MEVEDVKQLAVAVVAAVAVAVAAAALVVLILADLRIPFLLAATELNLGKLNNGENSADVITISRDILSLNPNCLLKIRKKKKTKQESKIKKTGVQREDP